jgi:DNA-binding response OmpR family regulator
MWDKTVVFMIADSLLERDVIFAMKNGADDYIQKPFNPRELAVKLVRFVERTHIS